jgi:hypothetical protein
MGWIPAWHWNFFDTHVILISTYLFAKYLPLCDIWGKTRGEDALFICDSGANFFVAAFIRTGKDGDDRRI